MFYVFWVWLWFSRLASVAADNGDRISRPAHVEWRTAAWVSHDDCEACRHQQSLTPLYSYRRGKYGSRSRARSTSPQGPRYIRWIMTCPSVCHSCSIISTQTDVRCGLTHGCSEIWQGFLYGARREIKDGWDWDELWICSYITLHVYLKNGTSQRQYTLYVSSISLYCVHRCL